MGVCPAHTHTHMMYFYYFHALLLTPLQFAHVRLSQMIMNHPRHHRLMQPKKLNDLTIVLYRSMEWNIFKHTQHQLALRQYCYCKQKVAHQLAHVRKQLIVRKLQGSINHVHNNQYCWISTFILTFRNYWVQVNSYARTKKNLFSLLVELREQSNAENRNTELFMFKINTPLHHVDTTHINQKEQLLLCL